MALTEGQLTGLPPQISNMKVLKGLMYFEHELFIHYLADMVMGIHIVQKMISIHVDCQLVNCKPFVGLRGHSC